MSLDFLLWREEPDERELLRLDLVGLASEVVTLSSRITDALGDANGPEAASLAALRQSLSQRALSVLAPQTQFDGISRDALRAALGILREDQRRMQELRRDVEGRQDW